MGSQWKIDLLQAEADGNDQSLLRLFVEDRTIKYITIEPGIYSTEYMCFGPSLVSIARTSSWRLERWLSC